MHDSKHKQALKKKEKRLMEDKMLDNQELLRQQRKVKDEQAEFERLRAVESQEDTMKNLDKKEYNKEREKRLLADKYIDNAERQRVVREAKRDEEWEVRARQVDDAEQTVHHLKVEEKKTKQEKRLKEDKYMDNLERQRVVREAKRDEEWEVRARKVDDAEATVHHLKVEEEKRQKEKRLKADKYIDNAERQRVVREAKRDQEWEVRARQVEDEEQTKYHLKKQEEFRLKEKRLKEDKYVLRSSRAARRAHWPAHLLRSYARSTHVT